MSGLASAQRPEVGPTNRVAPVTVEAEGHSSEMAVAELVPLAPAAEARLL